MTPYKVSLHPNGTISIPKLEVPNMIGMITDLNTFYVGVSEAIGVQNITKQGDEYKNPKELKGV